MRKTAAFDDVIRIFTPEGERLIPLSQVRAVLRKSSRTPMPGDSRVSHCFITPPAVGVELRSGEIVWSDGETDWYHSGEPARGETGPVRTSCLK
jgi:hypothetical protein